MASFNLKFMKPFFYFFFSLAIVVLTISSCQHSSKGNWSEESKEQFRQDMMGVEELSSFGANKEKWIECYLSKCEMNYDSYLQANKDETGCTALAKECGNEILSNGSVQGNWSQVDRTSFKMDMDTIVELDFLGENKSKWIECYLEKCEDNFTSYYHANTDESGCERLAAECGRELLGIE